MYRGLGIFIGHSVEKRNEQRDNGMVAVALCSNEGDYLGKFLVKNKRIRLFLTTEIFRGHNFHVNASSFKNAMNTENRTDYVTLS